MNEMRCECITVKAKMMLTDAVANKKDILELQVRSYDVNISQKNNIIDLKNRIDEYNNLQKEISNITIYKSDNISPGIRQI